ncbi:MAG TPA: LLM class flavin-dependent oxidoreductase [Candidatus Binatia bacterium]|nr:LLM class flavin-dependent oxidoreductase [Candidatus Binatia bacterium]
MQFGLFTVFDFFPDRQSEMAYYQDTLDLMISAEKLGFNSVWVGEEHFYSVGICPSPQLFLTVLARETTRLRLGTAVSLLPLEHPLRKAEDFAMLDLLSGGRLDFGVGRGSFPKHFEGLRVSLQESRARYEEALEIIERAWTQERFSYEGQFWQVPELSLSPKPRQKPCPPIYRGIVSPEAFETAGARGVLERITSMPDRVEERAIVGTPHDCRRRLAEVREEFGIERMALYFHAGARDITRARQGLELFAREVMPEFR